MKRIAAFIIVFALATGTARAAFEDNAGGARMRSLNGAFTAVADDSESVFAQPAATVLLRHPEVSFTYGRLFLGLYDESEIGSGEFAAAVPVSKEIGIGAGYKSVELTRVYAEQTMIVNASFRIREYMAAGFSMKYLGVKYTADKYTAIDPVFANGYTKSAAEADAGVMVMPFDFLTIAVAKKNILGSDLGLAEKSAAAPQDCYGACYREPEFALSAEVQKINSELRYVAGIEKYFLKDLFRGRFGMGWGDGSYRNLSAGIGFNLEQFVIDYAWEYPLSGIEQISGTHYLSITTKFGRRVAKAAPSATALPEPQVAASAVPAVIVSTQSAAAPENAALLLPGMLVPVKIAETALAPVSFELSTGAVPLPPLVSQPVIPEPPAEKPKVEPEVKKTTPPAVPGMHTYKAVEGDTLVSLSAKFYGDRTKWLRIYQANKDTIEKGAVRPGQTLIIP